MTAEILGGAQEVADAVVGHARAIAEIGRLHQAVVDDNGDAPMVGDAVRSPPRARPPPPPPLKVASSSSSMLSWKPLTLLQLTAAAVEHAQAELGEVGHEDVGKVDQGRSPFIGFIAMIGSAIRTESV